jgi:hypothetical protein
MHGLATKIKVKRSIILHYLVQFAYRKQLIQHKGHKRVTI